ncbi:MAG TPA: SDR family oxidoreductase [Pirellulaceae bacterium]|nr:SDR family oxidoreductase [Pirellulaceae bacterium]
MQLDLSTKTTIVTGAASGIGAATVRLFLEAGANVVAVDVNEPAAPKELQDKYAERLRCIVGDVARQDTSQRYVREALDAFGRIDVLVNNAAIAIIKPIADHSEEEWDRVMNVNVKSLYWSAKAVVPVMKEQKAGLILNTGSISSVVGLTNQGAYGPSKGAVIQITRQMAMDYAPFGIRVNAVCPGTVDTPLVRKAGIDSGNPAVFLKGLESAHPIGRIAQPEEIAAFFLFLASDHARFFTGAILMIDGGFTAQ